MNNPFLEHSNLDKIKSFKTLETLSKFNLKTELTIERINAYTIKTTSLNYSYATSLVNDEIISEFSTLASEQQLIKQYKYLLDDKIANISEQRHVSHHKSRQREASLKSQQDQIKEWVSQIHTKKIVSGSGKPFTHCVQIGIGGSELGPKALYLALKEYAKANNSHYITADFLSNIDPDEGVSKLNDIAFDQTLFIIVSKSGSTMETAENVKLLNEFAKIKGLSSDQLRSQTIIITTRNSKLDKRELAEHIFYMDESVGGRFSSSSAVGEIVLALAFGYEYVEEFFEGAAELDANALVESPKDNVSLMAALIECHEQTILNTTAKAIIPYSYALRKFPAHLQQLECESNGKSVTRNGDPITHRTSTVIFGEPGTNAQHSFFQMLHQGTDIISIQFILFSEPQTSNSNPQIKSNHTKLNANAIAQIKAFACGEDNEDPNKVFHGNRPSTILYANRLTPKVLGALLAFYENTVMFKGFLFNINSFDQEGVQLGKKLTNQLLNESEKDPILDQLSALLSH